MSANKCVYEVAKTEKCKSAFILPNRLGFVCVCDRKEMIVSMKFIAFDD